MQHYTISYYYREQTGCLFMRQDYYQYDTLLQAIEYAQKQLSFLADDANFAEVTEHRTVAHVYPE